MIPAKRKVGHGLFETLAKRGHTYASEHFLLKVFFGPVANPAKFSVVVPKKLEKSAVKRNAAKRRLYLLLRPFLSAAKPGGLCAVFLRKKFNKSSLFLIAAELQAALKKTGVVS